MSLLNRATDVVTVFPEEVTTSPDGNVKTRPSSVGIVCRAVVQPITSVSAGGGVTDELAFGFETDAKYRLRLVGWQGDLLGAQSQVDWRGKRYAILGEPRVYSGSRRTAHVDYVLGRR